MSYDNVSPFTVIESDTSLAPAEIGQPSIQVTSPDSAPPTIPQTAVSANQLSAPKPVRGRPPKGDNWKDKLAFILTPQGTKIFRVSCGYHIGKSGKRTPTGFYLGSDATIARHNRAKIRRACEEYKKQGYNEWPADILEALAQQDIVSRDTAITASSGVALGIINLPVKSEIEKTNELNRLRESDKSVALHNIPEFIATLATQEFVDNEMVNYFRRALKKHGHERPIESLKLWAELYKACKQLQSEPGEGGAVRRGPTVNVNVANMLPYDASEDRPEPCKSVESVIADVKGAEDANLKQPA